MIDLDEMGRETVVKEAWWEHHVVSSVPELWLILQVELKNISLTYESKSVHKVDSGEGVREESRVVESSSCDIDQSGENHSSLVDSLRSSNLEPVSKSENVSDGVASHLSLSNSEELEDLSNSSLSLGKSLVDDELQASSICKEPSLHTLRHF